MPYKDKEKQRKQNKESCKRYYQKNRKQRLEAGRERDHKRRYGITVAKRNEMFREQGSRCKSCGSSEPGSKVGWHLDHCHSTGKIRGILCHHCNLILGNAKDSAARLFAVINYLNNSSTPPN